MKREIIITNDGSKTIHIPEWNEQYHSKHGAILEAKHVYIKHGLAFFLSSEMYSGNSEISILEIGFGTGLNAFLTAIETKELNVNCNYVGVEGYPVSKEEIEILNYPEVLNSKDLFKGIHSALWEKETKVSNIFKLKKEEKQFSEIENINTFDVIYFDAFGPRVQPELWIESIFRIMYNALKTKGVLVTYCAQGDARRAMISVGFTVSKVEGPPGKRHMLRAIKG